jgi:hypothetical protein
MRILFCILYFAFFQIEAALSQTFPEVSQESKVLEITPASAKGFEYLACYKKQGACASKPKIEIEKKDMGSSGKFYADKPVKIFTAISSASIIGTNLKIELISKGYFQEYSGPIIDTIRKDVYEAKPVCAAIGHTFTLGIGILLNPIDSLQNAFGCTDETIIKREIDGAGSIKTGVGIWRDIKTTRTFVVSGFSKDYPESVNPYFHRSIFI